MAPPNHHTNRSSDLQDTATSVPYARDPKRLVAYLIPFPKPNIQSGSPDTIPTRFLIYTPPDPPFVDAPKDGGREGRIHKARRKWQSEIREAKTADPDTMS